MRAAVTGAGGFVGAAACVALRAAGHEVAALARPGGHEPPAGAAIFAGDLLDSAALDRLVAGAGTIIHSAAWVHRAAERASDRARCFEVNVGGTRALLEAAARAGRRPRFVFVSTVSVYGLLCENAREDSPARPENAYGESKLEAERLVLAAHAAGEVSGVVLRPCAVYGPGAPGNTRRLVSLLRLGIAPLVAGGANRKSMVHVEDLAAAIVRAAEAPAAAARVYNVAGEAISVRALCEAYARGLSRRVTFVPVPGAAAALVAAVSRAAARASGGRLPDVGRSLDVLMGENTVDAGAIARELGVSFRATESALEASVRGL